MTKLIIASQNPVKINAVAAAFERMFPENLFSCEAVSVASGVGNQPTTNAETLQGAWNRAVSAYRQTPEAHYWIGLEGGVEDHGEEMSSFAWAVVRSRDGVCGKGRSGTFFLPPRVAALIRAGKELGEADDIVFGRVNSKQDNGAVGILTGNVLDRTRAYSDAVVLALIPFKNIELYTL